MPLDVGKYQQGNKLTQPDYTVDESGVPTQDGSKAQGGHAAHPVPGKVSPTELQESIKTVGANAIRK